MAMALINLGCGRRVHPAWRNFDLTAGVAGVVAIDVRKGLPFPSDSCDAVYHSHLLEHLDPDDGSRLLAECFRVLKPGGTVRVVVPDLEGIARQYLSSLGAASKDPAAAAEHEWMTVELLDQMTRTRPGGRMRRFFDDERLPNRSFVQSRVGSEMTGGRSSAARPPFASRPRKLLARLRWKTALAAVAFVAGRQASRDLEEARFRASGEVHRWMYDRVSLERLLESQGFVQVALHSATDSRIPGFAAFELDASGGSVHKPDSLFIEAVKP